MSFLDVMGKAAMIALMIAFGVGAWVTLASFITWLRECCKGRKMIELNAEQISSVVFALVGDTSAHGESYIDKQNRENQQKLTEVIDALLWEVSKNTRYAERAEYTMKVIGNDARDFLRYLVEEYELNNYVRKEE